MRAKMPVFRRRAKGTRLTLQRRARRGIPRNMELRYHTPLDAPALRALGIPAPWGFGLADRVRFGEIDALGHVNNTAYLRWFESFRLPYLQARGVTDYGPESPRLVLKRASCDYLAEMLNGMDYVVTGRTRAFRTTSFTMEFAVWLPHLSGARQTATGEAIVVLLNRDGPGRYPIPEAGRRAFVEIDGAVAEGS
jgi:acyl-CoA thioester hydrolase